MDRNEQELRTADGGTPPVQPSNISGPAAFEGIPAIPEDALILVPTRNLVLFPGTVWRITLGRQRWVAAPKAGIRRSRPVGLRLQRDPATDDPMPADLQGVGTEAK